MEVGDTVIDHRGNILMIEIIYEPMMSGNVLVKCSVVHGDGTRFNYMHQLTPIDISNFKSKAEIGTWMRTLKKLGNHR